jgi:tetratricopeptide (TPR) repeat protein
LNKGIEKVYGVRSINEDTQDLRGQKWFAIALKKKQKTHPCRVVFCLRGLGDSFSIQRDMNVTKLEQQFNEFMNQMDYRGGIKVFKKLRGGKRDVYLAMLYDHLAVQGKWKRFYEWKARRLYAGQLQGECAFDALMGLGRICWHNNDRKAIGYYKKALAISPNNHKVYSALANIYKALGENKNARKNFEKAIELCEKKNFGLLLNYARFLIKLGEGKKAQEHVGDIEGLVAIMPESKTKEIAKEQLRQIKEAA